jgi:hypothetical protein
MYVIDTAVDDNEGCGVRVPWFDQPEAPSDLGSLGESVSLWLEVIDCGAWLYDQAARSWSLDHNIRGSMVGG